MNVNFNASDPIKHRGFTAVYKGDAWEVFDDVTGVCVDWEVGPRDRALAIQTIDRAAFTKSGQES